MQQSVASILHYPERENSMKKTIKILLVCIENRNFGDAVIADNTSYILNKIFATFPHRNYELIRYSIHTEDLSQIPYVDAIIFAGGGLIKYKYEFFYQYIFDIVSTAEQYNIPVYMNAMGVEGYDEEDERCQTLKKILQSPCIKGITIRDDFSLFQEKYISNGTLRTCGLFDPAVFCKDTYASIISNKKTDYIGLSIARDALFIDNGIESIDHDFLLEFWKNVALSLDEKNIPWKILTNGLADDEKFATEVLEYIGHGEKLDAPHSSQELVQNIHSFSAVIACRMHANIISYALGIPSIGLVWNDKLRFWGEKIGYPERFIPADQLQAENVVEALLKARKEGCRKVDFGKKRPLFHELRWFIKHYAYPREHKTESLNFKKYMLATALGTKDFRYRNMNTVDMLCDSYQNGYRRMELDLRLTSDGKIVCVNGWSEDTFKKLGYSDNTPPKALTQEDFLKHSYYGRFTTTSFEMLLQTYSKQTFFNQVTFLLDIGIPDTEGYDLLLDELDHLFTEYHIDRKKMIIRLQTKDHVYRIKKRKLGVRIAFFLPHQTEKHENLLLFCQKQRIKLLSMHANTFTDELAATLKEKGFLPIILSYKKTGDMISAIEKGAFLVGSFTYPVKYLNRLTK